MREGGLLQAVSKDVRDLPVLHLKGRLELRHLRRCRDFAMVSLVVRWEGGSRKGLICRDVGSYGIKLERSPFCTAIIHVVLICKAKISLLPLGFLVSYRTVNLRVHVSADVEFVRDFLIYGVFSAR